MDFSQTICFGALLFAAAAAFGAIFWNFDYILKLRFCAK